MPTRCTSPEVAHRREGSPLILTRLWLVLGFLACCVLFYLCLMHNPPPEPHISNFDKVEHATAYVILGCWFGAIVRPRYLLVLAGLSIFGAFIEVAQWYSGYRDGDIWDWVADTLGCLIGLGLVQIGAMRWLAFIDRHAAAATDRT